MSLNHVASEKGGGRVSSGLLDRDDHRSNRRKNSYLWLWFITAFVIQGAAWTAWFIVASRHQVAEVPLATAPGHK